MQHVVPYLSSVWVRFAVVGMTHDSFTKFLNGAMVEPNQKFALSLGAIHLFNIQKRKEFSYGC